MRGLYRFIATAGIWAVSGVIAGAFAGGVFGLVQFVTPQHVLPLAVVLAVALGLALLAWLVVLVVVGVFGNYGVRAIASRSLVTAGVTGVLAVLLVHTTRAGLAGLLVGWMIGFLVGEALCKVCDVVDARAV